MTSYNEFVLWLIKEIHDSISGYIYEDTDQYTAIMNAFNSSISNQCSHDNKPYVEIYIHKHGSRCGFGWDVGLAVTGEKYVSSFGEYEPHYVRKQVNMPLSTAAIDMFNIVRCTNDDHMKIIRNTIDNNRQIPWSEVREYTIGKCPICTYK